MNPSLNKTNMFFKIWNSNLKYFKNENLKFRPLVKPIKFNTRKIESSPKPLNSS